MKHATVATKAKTERVVNLNVICKEITNEGKEELKAGVVPVTLVEEGMEERAHTKPGMPVGLDLVDRIRSLNQRMSSSLFY